MVSQNLSESRFLSLQEITFPKMVANCCRFLCYFCRISRQNQKAMFDHLSYLLENSSVGLGESLLNRTQQNRRDTVENKPSFYVKISFISVK